MVTGEIAAGDVTIVLPCVQVAASLVPGARSTIPSDGVVGILSARRTTTVDVVVDGVGSSEGGRSRVAEAGEILPLLVCSPMSSDDLGVAMLASTIREPDHDEGQ